MPSPNKRDATPMSPSQNSQQGRRDKFRADDSQIEARSQRGGISLASGPRGASGRDGEDGDGETDVREDDGEEQEEEEEEEEYLIRTLSINCVHQKIAAAFHDPESRVMSFLEDTEDSTTFDTVKTLLEQLRPTYVIAGSRSPEKLFDVITEYCDENDTCNFQIRPFKEFYLTSSLIRLSQLRILMPGHTSSSSGHSSNGSVSDVDAFVRNRRQGGDAQGEESDRSRETLLKLGCFTNLEAVLAVGAGGALLSQLQRQKAIGREDDALMMRSVEAIHLERHMLIDADALSSLQIFGAQDGASMFSNKQREGLSLFGIINTCFTPLGSNLLRQWILRPLLSLEEISARHDAISVFLNPENQAVVDTMSNQLRKIKNVHTTLNRLRKGGAGFGVWRSLMDFGFAAIVIRENLTELRGGASTVICHKIEDVVDISAIRPVIIALGETIDWDASRQEQDIIIQAGVDPEIDRLQELLAGLEETLQKAASIINSEIPDGFAHEMNVVMFPQLGYLVALQPVEGVSREDAPEGWRFQFDSDNLWYFKETRTMQLDQHIGDLYNSIKDRTIDICGELLERIFEIEPVLLASANVCSELDCLLALARAANVHGLRRPNMVVGNCIEIRKGRHILYEQVTDTYVANDTSLEGGRGVSGDADMDQDPMDTPRQSMMLLTSSNGSGKSAYVKQVGLIVFMAQIGSFVPAEAATLSPVDKLYTRLQTRESVAKAASAFMIDLGQVSLALRGATAHSLVILDEFGKGTNPEDGAGLLAGVIMHLLNRGNDCPKTIAITHFHELFTNNFLSSDLPIGYWQMETVYNEADRGGVGSLTYLYKLVESVGETSSRAAECALVHGIPVEIVERARFVSEQLSQYEIGKIIDDIEMTDEDIDELQEAEALTRKFLAWNLTEQGDDDEPAMEILKRMIREAEGDDAEVLQ